ncbi:NAD(P)H-dependent oxidoreductase [Streptomyces sp. NPDC048288]|uniref:NAD(P)H-dependent oxidoreductase n=1 Tax=Streptomyces sp. NPDC048288 TaxID=3365529 RepID=UPI0037216A2C
MRIRGFPGVPRWGGSPGLRSVRGNARPDSLAGRLVVLGATGGSARHQLALEYSLRPLFAHLRAETVPTAVFAAPGDWAPDGAARLSERIGRAARELAARLRSHAGPRHTR